MGHRFNKQFLTQARKAQGLTQSELAAKVSVHRNTIAAWESLGSEREPGKTEIGQLGEVLSVDPDHFFLETGTSGIVLEHLKHHAWAPTLPGLKPTSSLSDVSERVNALYGALLTSSNPLEYDRFLWDRTEEELQQVGPGALKTARDYLALSLNDVSNMTGLSVSRLTEIETRQGLPLDGREIMELREALGAAFDPRAVAYSGLSLATNVKDRRPSGVRLQESRRIWNTECQRTPNKLETILAELRQLRREVEELKAKIGDEPQ